MCDTELINQDIYIGAENEYNLFTLRRNNTSENEEVRRTLEIIGRYHIGDLVTRFRHGSLVMRARSKRHNDEMDVDMEEISAKKKEKMKESDYTAEILEQLSKPILFGTVSGCIGIIAQLPEEQFHYFSKLQEAMNCVIKGVGNFKHETFRAFKSERRIEFPAMNFLDGDLIESFLDLKKERQMQVSNEMNRLTKNEEISSVDEIAKRIEELAISLH
jgi:DNA damage-binding protein 1